MDDELKPLMNAMRIYIPHGDLTLVERAFLFAKKAHQGQLRQTGEPYINHVIATARRLADWHFSPTIVAAGLLHDVPEDTPYSIEEIRKQFPKDIAAIVAAETKLSTLRYQGVERYAENLRKFILAMVRDVRVLFVKFADRAHNLETLSALPEHKRRRIALETLEIYAPIANRLGMGEIRGLLEDLSFPYVLPEEHLWLTNLIKGKFEEKEQRLKTVKEEIKKELAKAKISALDVHGRTKHLFSLYRKLLRYDRDLSKVYDLVAIRIIVPTVSDCYTVLGIIHQRWKPLKGRIKDYIAQPKPNGYQSLHTTVFTDEGEIVEFQIRTKEMHEEAEFGIAAHWRYKEHGEAGQPKHHHRLRWLEELAHIQKELHDRKEFLETIEELKIDAFQNRIFVFTPRGDVLDLPEQSTPIDFAYAIHTDLGDHCSGARINGAMAALETKLNSGDIIEIVTDAKRRGPSPDWLKFVRTRHARQTIKTSARRGVGSWIRSIIPGNHEKQQTLKRKRK
ncbi:bifunctional (p)ppGpp synthetase/guanosine-3',5'-bis(diphosphate) 3'-pyrophosphohydrolase [Candidatus Uhrbacteria bacterium]|nr:bifunctional (p)ppGpp synthetase/guanosine-3',5'-bis(diphosphate) 3'-pyrophosphohydrolase [Candidatus Uhrbacteria bacterium]